MEPNLEPNVETLTPPTPVKPSSKGPATILLIVVLALAAAAAGVWFFFLNKTPQQVLLSAFEKTTQEIKTHQEALVKKYPLLAEATPLETATVVDYSATFAGIEGMPYAQMISSVLTGARFDMQMATDPAEDASSASFAVVLRDEPFLTASMVSNPDLMVFSVPELFSQALSIAPKTLAADYQASALGKLYPADADMLEQLQTQLTSQTAAMQALDQASLDRIEKRFGEIGMELLKGAEFSEVSADNYQVVVAGPALSKALSDTLDLLVAEGALDSTTMSDPTFLSDLESLKKQLSEQGVATTSITLKNGVIAEVVASLNDTAGDTLFTISYFHPSVSSHRISYDFSNEYATYRMNILFEGTEKDNSYSGLCTVSMADSSYPDDDMMAMNLSMTVDTKEALSFEAAVKMYDEDFMSMQSSGTASVTKDMMTCSLPKSKISVFTAPGVEPIVILLDLNFSQKPLPEKIVAPAHLSLFGLDDKGIYDVELQVMQNMEALSQKAATMMLGM